MESDVETNGWKIPKLRQQYGDFIIGFSPPIIGFEDEFSLPMDLTCIQGARYKQFPFDKDRAPADNVIPPQTTFHPAGIPFGGKVDYFPSVVYLSSPVSVREKFRDQVGGVSPSSSDLSRVNLHNQSEMTKLIMDFLTSGGFGGRLKAEAISLLVMTEIFDSVSGYSKKMQEKVGLGVTKVSKIRDYVHQHCDSDLSIERLSELVGVSSFHFSRMFKQETGMSPHQYVIQERLERAKQLMFDRSLSLAEVAYSTGFSSQSHMTECFRRRTGLTPSNYRKLLLD